MSKKILAVLALSLLAAYNAQISTARAQNTTFTYQGRVLDNGTAFTGTGQFQFALVYPQPNQQAVATPNMGGNPPFEFVNGFTIGPFGFGYLTPPAVTITGGGGSGAAATASLLGSSVTSLNIINPGSGYSSAPTVTIAPPPNSYYTYWSNDGTSVNGSEPATNVIVAVTNGLFTVVLGDTNLNMAAIPVSVFNQPNLQLQIWFNDGTHGFAALTPPQPLTPTPYAVYATTADNAISVSAANIVGTIPATHLPASVITNDASGVNITGSFSGNGGGLTNINADQLTGFSFATPPASGAPILNMVWIVPGTFVMGSPSSDPDYQSAEGPQTVATLTNGFWMGKHLVTQGEYLAVTGGNPSFFTGDLSLPVDNVSWLNATNFCNLLTQRELGAGRLPVGYVYRLPTEAEWEYCCRALTTSRYFFGNDPGDLASLTNYAWYSANSGFTTHPVGQLLANPWGLVDMTGNIYEWCLDLYGAYPGGSVINPLGATTGSPRVLRGGLWTSSAANCRSAARGNAYPALKIFNYINGSLGFRVVLAENVTPYASANNDLPILLTCSANITVPHTSSSGAQVYFTATASGGCSANNLSSSPPSGSTFPLGTTTVTTTASDTCGETNTCSFTVTVN